MIFFGLWLVQGLDGAPRRWSVLPSRLRHAHAHLAAVRLHPRRRAGAVLLERDADPARQGRASRRSTSAVSRARRRCRKDCVGAPRRGQRSMIVALALAFIFAVGGYLVGREHGIGRRRHADDDGRDGRRWHRCDHRRCRGGSRGVRELIVRRTVIRSRRRERRARRPVARRDEALGGARDRTSDERHERHARRITSSSTSSRSRTSLRTSTSRPQK